MNRKAEKFFDAITLLREDLVEEAQNYVFRRKRSAWKSFGSLAACIALVASLGMLAILPRGCGAGGMDSSSSGSMNNNSAPPASSEPAAPPPDANGDIPYGDGAADDWNSSAAPSDPPGADVPPNVGMGGPAQFNAQVLEILEDEVLVELLPDEVLPMGASCVHIPITALDGLPPLHPGDVVAVSCETLYLVDGEAVAEAAGTEVQLLEPDGP